MNKEHKCLDSFYRKGRADYHCIECEKDITLELMLLHDIDIKLSPTHKKVGDSYFLIS